MLRAAIHNPYWNSLGGGERYTAAFIKLLLDKDWEVDIWWPENISSQIKNRFGIDIDTANFVNPPSNYQLSTINYQLVFWVSDGSIPVSFAKKTIIHFQFPFTKVDGKSVANLIKSRFYIFVANSQFTKKIVDAEFAINSSVIYPPIETNEYKPGDKTNTILFVSRFSNLTQQKGHRVLVDAFSKIYPQVKNWKLILAGGVGVGTSDSEIKELKLLSQGKPVEIITNPSYERVKTLYSEAKIYCSPSGYGIDENREPTRVEHFGITVVEAMASGCVPVIFNAGGHKEIVDDQINGYLWNTLAELETTLLKLMTDNSKLTSMALAAREKSGMFDTNIFNSQFDKLI